jgi:hypothetical protein
MSDDKINQSGQRNVSVGANLFGDVHTGDTIIQPASVGVAALRQIPSPPRDFTGREDEINELMQALENGGVTISGLQGQGGIGKTTLALELARRLKGQYPDAHFFLDLKGVSTQPLSTADAMAHVIRACHPTAKLPDSEAELRPIYNSALHGQRALLLLDNARDRNQVEPLVPPESCLLIVTSRRHFTLPGMFPKDLGAMPPGDAQKLLLKIAPRIGDLAETLANLCGHLPLALRLAASALAERRDLKPADYARRWEDAKQRLALIDASLSLSYDLLDEPLARERWRALAVFPDSFDVAGAAAVWRMGDDAAQDALGELLNLSLLEWKEDKERYRLHDLSRVFANSRFGEDERASAALLHAKHYQNVSSIAEDLLLKGGEAILQALTRFDSEWINIKSGQDWVAQHAGRNRKVGRLCVDYPRCCPNLLLIRLHPRERICWLEA